MRVNYSEGNTIFIFIRPKALHTAGLRDGLLGDLHLHTEDQKSYQVPVTFSGTGNVGNEASVQFTHKKFFEHSSLLHKRKLEEADESDEADLEVLHKRIKAEADKSYEPDEADLEVEEMNKGYPSDF